MTALALSPNRKYIAIAERGEKPSITIYELLHDQSKKRKVCKFWFLNTINFFKTHCFLESIEILEMHIKKEWFKTPDQFFLIFIVFFIYI